MNYEFFKNGLMPCYSPSFYEIKEHEIIDNCYDFEYSQDISSCIKMTIHGFSYEGDYFIRCYERNMHNESNINVLSEKKITKQLKVKDYIKSICDYYLINEGVKLNIKPLSFIYFIKANKFIKIGVSNEPKKRISAISTGNPFDCEFIGCVIMESQYAYNIEKLIHNHYNKYRESGEWFCIPMDDILNTITYLKFGKIIVSKGEIVIPKLSEYN